MISGCPLNAIRQKYPNLQQSRTKQIIADGPANELSIRSETVWRFTDTENHWQVSLASNFVALDTSSYLSRQDFLQRIQEIIRGCQ